MLVLTQEDVENILKRFNMKYVKPVTTPLAWYFKITKDLCPKIKEEQEYMTNLTYVLAARSLMYAMVYTRLGIAQTMGVVSRLDLWKL